MSSKEKLKWSNKFIKITKTMIGMVQLIVVEVK